MNSPKKAEISKKPKTRDTKRSLQICHYPENVDRWAVIVGITKYKYERWNLEYARQDAEALYEMIQKPSCGDFPKENIKALFDEEATEPNIRSALRDFLKKPRKEDLVLIYFACHGASDPDRPENFYLLAHNTELDKIAGTALPMREIRLSLEENLIAERVIIIADTCHSAALNIRGDRANEVNQYLKSLSSSRKGIAWLTSAEANEVSREDEKWGGGHGVFTYYLLEGMKGAADTKPRDGKVTLGELFEYVREKVKEETNDQQNPLIGATLFDRNLPMAITGGLQAQEHCDLGHHLYKLGWILDDKGRFESASKQFSEALRLGRQQFPRANLGLGQSWLALGKLEKATEEFQKALDQDKGLHEAYFWRGIAYAKLNEIHKAINDFQMFQTLQPEDNRVPYTKYLATILEQPSEGTRYALLIGIGKYSFSNLKGPENDVEIMHHVLVDRYDFENVTTLRDDAATRAGILNAIDALRQKTHPGDTVVIYYSGHALGGDSKEYLIPYDYSNEPGGSKNTIGSQEFHDLINLIPASHKTLVLDTHATNQFVALASNHPSYTVFLATSPGKTASESRFEDKGRAFFSGTFTFAFVHELEQASPYTSQGKFYERLVKRMSGMEPQQEPLWIGNSYKPLFPTDDPTNCLEFFNFSQRLNYDNLTLEEINSRYDDVQESFPVSFPQLHCSFGSAFLDKKDYQKALQALQAAVEQSQKYPEAVFALGMAQLHTQQHSEVLVTFQRYLELKPEHCDYLQKPLELLEKFRQDRKHALLIGIDEYSKASGLHGAVNDIRAFQRVLTEKFAFQEPDIKLLTNKEATRKVILQEFDDLVKKAQNEPALFFFAGNGSLNMEGAPTIVCYDSRQEGVFDIELSELSDKVGNIPTNLVTIIDAGWSPGLQLPWGTSWGSRFVSPDDQPRPIMRDIVLRTPRRTWHEQEPAWKPDEEDWIAERQRINQSLQALQIGRLSIYNISIQSIFESSRQIGGEAIVEVELEELYKHKARPDDKSSGVWIIDKAIYGVLTHALLSILKESDQGNLTGAQLVQMVSEKLKWLQPFFVSQNLEENILCNAVREREVYELIKQHIIQEPIHQTISILRRLIEGREDIDPEGNLNLGVAYAALDDYDKSIKALENAIGQKGDQSYPEAHYYLGRVLFESENPDIDRAVSELRQATKDDPNIIPAHYFLGKVIRASIKRNALVEAEQAFRTYLDRGAPLGKRDEVQQLISSGKGIEAR